MPNRSRIVAALAALVASIAVVASARAQTPVPAVDPGVETRIDGLIAQMTVAEKFGQLQMLDGNADGTVKPEHRALVRQGLMGSALNVRGAANVNALQKIAVEQSRLKIPLLYGFDVIHGYRTIFPVPLGESAAWDPALAERAAQIAAREAAAAGVRWTFAPMVDIARDPRWGRIVEGSGEDPYLGSALAAARVRGFQGSLGTGGSIGAERVAATAKHFAAYGGAEGGRDYNTVDVSQQRLRDVYLPPFKAALDAGVETFMTAFNTVNGVPATGNPFLMTDLLRGEWGFSGAVVSDYTAVQELIAHGFARDEADAARLALNAGTDIEMVSKNYVEKGPALLASGAISQATLNEAVRRVLRLKFRLGLFDTPYVDPAREKTGLLTSADRSATRAAAADSMVLLKNSGGALPLKRSSLRSVAVVGPLSSATTDLIGSWSGDGRADDVVSVADGVRTAVGRGVTVRTARGCGLPCRGTSHFGAAVRAARRSDVTVVVVGEAAAQSGEASVRSKLGLPGRQRDLVARIAATGKPYVVVLMNGRPLTLDPATLKAPGLLEAWYPGTEGGNAVADVLFGKVNPAGKLPATFPRSVGQIPLYYSHDSTGRPADPANKYTSKYLDESIAPRFEFGYGLSYTTFALRNLKLGAASIPASGSLTATVEVANTGKRSGSEVVQLYIRDRVASVAQPVKVLKGFEKVALGPGQVKTVTFTLKGSDLAFTGADGKPRVEPGAFDLWVSNRSSGGLRSAFSVSG